MKAAIFSAVLFCVLLIGGAVYLSSRGSSSNSSRLVPLDPAYTERLTSGGWSMGATNPKVTIIEYGDFQCPGCAALYPIADQSVKANASTVKFIFRNFPLDGHNKSRIAAAGAEAAGRQGKFWQMHQLLYAQQTAWRDQTISAFRNTLIQYAQSIGVNIEQFKRDLDDDAVTQVIDEDRTEGTKLPVQATPTLVVNGKVVESLPTTVDQFNALIQNAAETTPVANPTP